MLEKYMAVRLWTRSSPSNEALLADCQRIYPISLKPNSRVRPVERSSTRRLPVDESPLIIPGNTFPGWSCVLMCGGMPESGSFWGRMFIGPSIWPVGRVV